MKRYVKLPVLILSMLLLYLIFTPSLVKSSQTPFYPSIDGGINYKSGIYWSCDQYGSLTAGERWSDSLEESLWHRSFIRFNISSIPNNASIESATFYIYYSSHWEEVETEGVCELAHVADMGDSLDESDWSLSILHNYGTFVEKTTDYGWKSADVTSSIEPTNSFVTYRLKGSIEDLDDVGWKWVFTASEESNKPYLEIVYTCVPNPPDNLKVESQVSPQRLTTFTPEFSFRYTDNDGDNMKAFRIQVGTSAGDNSMLDNTTTENAENGDTVTITYASDNALSRGVQYYWRARVQDNNDNWSGWSDNENFKINGLPTCSITAPPDGYAAEVDQGIGFTSSASDPDNDSLTWHWDFGDLAGTSSQQNPSYSYDSTGDYTATLYVNDGYESSASDSITVSVGGGAPPPPPPAGGGGVGGVVRDIVEAVEVVAEPDKNVLFKPILTVFGFGISPLILLGGAALAGRQTDQRGIMWAALIFLVFLFTMGSRIFG